VNLNGANLDRADLKEANLNDTTFVGAKLNRDSLLTLALSGVSLREVDLSSVNLNGVDLSGVNLSGVDFSKTQALGTNFKGATLTGACLQDWNINSATNLEDVICDYVYLQRDRQERQPSSGNFAPGEFTRLFQKVLSTVDLVFHDGINWQAFASSFRHLQEKARTVDFAIKAIETREDGSLAIRVSLPPGANKFKIQRFIEGEYQKVLQAIEDKAQYQRREKEEQVDLYRQHGINLWEIAKLAAQHPIQVNTGTKHISGIVRKGNVVPDSPAMKTGYASTIQLNQFAEDLQVANPDAADVLAQAAQEIWQLLKQLETTNPAATDAERQAYVKAAIPLPHRALFLRALKGDWQEQLSAFLAGAYLRIAIAVLMQLQASH